MDFRALGRTEIKVSLICLGTMTWGEQNTEAEAHAQLDYALDRGINFIDAAEMYPVPPRAETQGRTERHNGTRSEEHTSELQSLMRISYAVFCLKQKRTTIKIK